MTTAKEMYELAERICNRIKMPLKELTYIYRKRLIDLVEELTNLPKDENTIKVNTLKTEIKAIERFLNDLKNLDSEQQPRRGDTLVEFIQPNWGGDYRLEYDGKYVTLFGKDKNYARRRYDGEDGETDYEEMVLVPVLCEGKGLEPEIVDVNDKYITVRLWK